jgi:phospholipid/cholesterol/gamma-HCH transport system substrate-binding protein
MDMKQRTTECIVGIFVVIGVLCFGYLSVRFARMDVGGADEYEVSALFADLGGLRAGAAVQIAGVQVGRVVSLDLGDQYSGKAVLGIRKGLELPTDTVAAIKTKGLIGEKFVSLLPGNAKENIKPDGQIRSTESGSMELPFGDVTVGGGSTYQVRGVFTHLGGLKVGAPVEIAGVAVGSVREVELNDMYNADVTMDIRADIKLSSDTFASIHTKGIIGGKYVLLEPGGDVETLKDGDVIEDTEPAVDIESIISKLVQGNVK